MFSFEHIFPCMTGAGCWLVWTDQCVRCWGMNHALPQSYHGSSHSFYQSTARAQRCPWRVPEFIFLLTVSLLFASCLMRCVCNNFPRPWKLCLFKKKKDQENCASVKNLLVLQEIFIFIYCRIYWHLLKISCVSVVMTSFMSWDAHMRCIFPVESKYLDQLVRISGACGNHAPFQLICILCIFVRAASCFAIFPDAQRRMPFFILQKSWYKRENTSKVSSYIQSQYFIPNGLSANAYGTMVLSFWPRLFFPQWII